MIPPDANAAFVATMEDVLEVYQRPHDPQRPLVCLDETSKQLIIEMRAPIPAKPGQPARHDYEYERNGVANLFMVFAPLEGWRHVKVTDRHTAIDYAHVLRDLSDTHFPDTAKIVLVQDNLNIHKPASLYEAFPAPEARRLVERFEWHYTPKHGSWLDLAESELGVLASQCLDRRIADKQILAHEVTAWQDHRNKHHAKADWQFTTANARVKLKRLYPQFDRYATSSGLTIESGRHYVQIITMPADGIRLPIGEAANSVFRRFLAVHAWVCIDEYARPKAQAVPTLSPRSRPTESLACILRCSVLRRRQVAFQREVAAPGVRARRRPIRSDTFGPWR